MVLATVPSRSIQTGAACTTAALYFASVMPMARPSCEAAIAGLTNFRYRRCDGGSQLARSLQRGQMPHAGEHDEFCSADTTGQLSPQEWLGLDFVGIPDDDGGRDIDVLDDLGDVQRHASLCPCGFGRRSPAQRIVDHLLPECWRKLP